MYVDCYQIWIISENLKIKVSVLWNVVDNSYQKCDCLIKSPLVTLCVIAFNFPFLNNYISRFFFRWIALTLIILPPLHKIIVYEWKGNILISTPYASSKKGVNLLFKISGKVKMPFQKTQTLKSSVSLVTWSQFNASIWS